MFYSRVLNERPKNWQSSETHGREIWRRFARASLRQQSMAKPQDEAQTYVRSGDKNS